VEGEEYISNIILFIT